MTIDPKEQAFYDNLKAEFKKGGISKVENKILDALHQKFDAKDVNGNEVVTTPAEVIKIVKDTVAEDKADTAKDLQETRKTIADLNSAITKTGANKFINLGKGAAQIKKAAQEVMLQSLQSHADDTREFDKPATYSTINAMATAQLSGNGTAVMPAPEKPESRTNAPAGTTTQSALPPTLAANETRSSEEATFLNKFRDTFAVNGKLSGVVGATYDALKTEFDKPGKTGWKEMGTIAATIHNQMVEDVKSGKIDLEQAVDGPIKAVSKTKETPAHPRVDNGDIKELLLKIHGEKLPDGTIRGPLITSGKDKGKYATPLEIQVEKANMTSNTKEQKATLKELTNAQEKLVGLQDAVSDGIGQQYDWKKIVDLAKQPGQPYSLPEHNESPLIAVVREAAGDDKMDSKELQALLKSDKFKTAAKLVVGEVPTKLGTHNETGKANDKLKVGSQDISLADAGIEFADDGVNAVAQGDGEVSSPKTPAKTAPAAKPKKSGRGQ